MRLQDPRQVNDKQNATMTIERCLQCQHQLTAGDNFCASCGASVRPDTEDTRSDQLVPDLPFQATAETASTNTPAPPSQGTTPVERFFDHEFPGIGGAAPNPWVSTAFVVVLQVVTFGIWPVHYMKRLTEWLDEAQSEQQAPVLPPAISPEFMAANFVFAYTNAAAVLLQASDPENLSYYVFGSLIGIIGFVLHVIWAFKLRTGLQLLWQSKFQHAGLLSGFLTFVLGVIYLNFKILGLKTRSDTTPGS
jgi:hypothetical protein